METLEKARSIFAITRDMLLIILFIVLILTGLSIMNFFNSLDPEKLSCENMVNSVMTGDLDVFTGTGGITETYTPTQEMLSLMDKIETAAMSGEKTTAQAKLDELRTMCLENGYPEAVEKIDALKTAIEEENYVKALGTASQLKKLFGQ